MRRDQKRRAILLFSALLAFAMVVRQVTKRSAIDDGRSPANSPGPIHQVDDAAMSSKGPLSLERGERSALVQLARRTLEGEAFDVASQDLELDASATGEGASDFTAMISLPRQQRSAWVARGRGPSPAAATAAAAADLAQRATPDEIANGRLKLDLVVESGEMRTLDQALTFERSLYGLWLPELDLLLLPEELEARRLVDSDGDLRPSRLASYLAEGGRGRSIDLSRLALNSYRIVTFESLAEGLRLGGVEPPPIRLFRGNDRSPDLSPDALLAASRRGGNYLRSAQKADGSFIYSYDPKRHQEDDDDNLLRRAGTCYSLVQLHRAAGEPAAGVPAAGEPAAGVPAPLTDATHPSYLEVARRGLAALLDDFTRPMGLPGMDDDTEALVSPGDELKLGGSALLLLALMEYQEVSGDRQWLQRGQNLARFLAFQQEDDGHFISKISTSGKRFDFESGYYPGEAILALTRLYEADGDPRWLDVAVRGADWLIEVRDAGKETSQLAHDHWLLMGLEALHRLRGDAAHATHAGRIAQAIVDAQRLEARHLDWVGSFYDPPRSTPTATRAEALVAMVALARQTGEEPRPYIEALLRMAAFQRRCQFNEVSAMYLERPDLALGGFRRGLTHYEIRIDYVQHNISSLLGLRHILGQLSQG